MLEYFSNAREPHSIARLENEKSWLWTHEILSSMIRIKNIDHPSSEFRIYLISHVKSDNIESESSLR